VLNTPHVPPSSLPTCPRLPLDALQLAALVPSFNTRKGRTLKGGWTSEAGVVLALGHETLHLRLLPPIVGPVLGDEPPRRDTPFGGWLNTHLKSMKFAGAAVIPGERALRLRLHKVRVSGKATVYDLWLIFRGPHSQMAVVEEGIVRLTLRNEGVEGWCPGLPPPLPQRQPFSLPPKLAPLLPDWDPTTFDPAAPWHRVETPEGVLLHPLPLLGATPLQGDPVQAWSDLALTRLQGRGAAQQTRKVEALLQRLEAEKTRLEGHREGLMQRIETSDPAPLWRQAEALKHAGRPALEGGYWLVDDWHSDPPETLRIAKGEHPNPQGLAQALYRQAERATRIREGGAIEAGRLEEQIEEVAGRMARVTAGLETPADEPPKTGGRVKGKGRLAGTPPPPLRRDAQGLEVLIGRSRQGNDRLTFGIAKPYDLWLHIKDLPGPHVVLRLPRKGFEPPMEAVVAAAKLAVQFAGGEGKHFVEWCPIHQVRRMPDGGPGEVTYHAAGGVWVEGNKG